MPPDRRRLLQALLNALERAEARLLAWGVVDGAFAEDEVLDIADDVLAAAGDTRLAPEDLLDLAERHRLVFPFPAATTSAAGAYGTVYRTRMAETVRLLARLRQLGPGRPWRAAPSLVADYRFTVRPRAYPERHRAPADVRAALAEATRLTHLQEEVLTALLHDEEGKPLQLADFQVEATARILADLDRPRNSRGTIVSAGTGSGKTLAFRLPAFLRIAHLIAESPQQDWVKAVALYPRNELLKDQLSSGVAEARKLDGVLQARGARPLSIGAYYGDTPLFASVQAVGEWAGWPQSAAGDGFVCPYLRGPDGEPLTWREEDIATETERLIGQTTDGKPIDYGPDIIRLTRRSAVADPPDIVFTTTEMMNRLMSHDADRRVIGLDASRAPELALLDEAHTYTGITGAHTAYLLRRWRHALRGRPQFVGLSATLVGAEDFFARLLGIRPASVVEVTPREDQLVQEGAEYLVALRGDPASGTSLLSTSIQAAMLLGRALDPPRDAPSGGLYGRRSFVFTDNLDVTNRLYYSLLDAEGQDSWGRRTKSPLARTRSDLEDENARRLAAGQNWRFAEDIGHPVGLDVPLRIDRTSSQDAGVDAGADVVVATASLEVGFDDPTVGAVLQHKAPLDNASFLQRKGRAGRPRVMRPWTVVVLSDYGRDRAAYQGYDALFDPTLREQPLPIANRYVLRTQAGFAFMDWLATRVGAAGGYPDHLWRDLAYPPRNERKERRQHLRAQRQAWLAGEVRTLLEDERATRDLARYLEGALGVDENEVTALLWDPPRALMTAVLPTLLRRLEHRWRRWTPDEKGSSPEDAPLEEEPYGRDPLPDFLPPNFFTDLNLPEVDVLTPAHHHREEAEHPMPVRQALQEFAPGRVSRRFGIHHANDAYWVPIDLDHDEVALDIASFLPAYEATGRVLMRNDEGVTSLPFVRPRRVQTALAPDSIRQSSNAFPAWTSSLLPHADTPWQPVSDRTGWNAIVPRVAFHLHRDDRPAEVARVATGARAEIGFVNPNREDQAIKVAFEMGGRPVGVGFRRTFDAATFALEIPPGLGSVPPDPGTPLGRALRVAYLHHQVVSSPELEGLANPFARAWLAEALVAGLATAAPDDEGAPDAVLRRAYEAVWQGDVPPIQRALKEVMAAAALNADDDAERRGHDRVGTLLHSPDVRSILDAAAETLWGDDLDDNYRQWVRHRFKATVGGALLQACYALCPEIGGGDLLLDLDGGPRTVDGDTPDEIWVSESAVGGTGLLEAFARRYADDPRRFFRLVEDALSTSDAERVDHELTRTLELLDSDSEVRAAVAAIRGVDGLHALRTQTVALRRVLGERGVLCSHAVFAALQARVLRPGSSPETDALLLRLIQAWHDLESRLGLEVDARAFSLWAADHEAFRDDVDALVPGPSDTENRFSVLYGLVWPRGRALRARALSAYNPFSPLPEADRLLVAPHLSTVPTATLNADGWQDTLRNGLRERGTARLRAPLGRHEALTSAVLSLVQAPLDVGFLHLHPSVEGIERDAHHVTATLTLPESVQ